MQGFSLNDSVITKKVIDLLVHFIRKNAKRSRLYEQTKVTDRFSLEAVRIPAVIVKNVSNTQRRTDYTDFIHDVHGRIELVPISGDNTLVGNNIIRTNLPESLDYDPRWAFDPTIGFPSGYGFSGNGFVGTGTIPANPSYDITEVVFTSQTGGNFSPDITTGIVVTLPPPATFEPSSMLYGLDAARSNGSNGPDVPNPIVPNFRTVNISGLILETHNNTTFTPSASGNFEVPLNLNVLPIFKPVTIDYTWPGNPTNSLFVFGAVATSGINAVYSGNNTTFGTYPFSGVGINGAGWFQSGSSIGWTNGAYATYAAAVTAGQIPASGSIYGVDYNYQGPDVHNIAVALNDTQDQFYLIYSGISLGGSTVMQPVEPGQYIVNASGLVPGLTGTVIKLNDVLWAGDQYQALTWNTTIPTYAVYGGLYEISIQFECYANSTVEAQELGDLVQNFLVEYKKQPYDLDAFNFTAWSQGGQGEEDYINDHIFSTSVSADGFRFWQEYRGVDVISNICMTAIPTGYYTLGTGTSCPTLVPVNFAKESYIAPGVESIVTTTNPVVDNQTNWDF